MIGNVEQKYWNASVISKTKVGKMVPQLASTHLKADMLCVRCVCVSRGSTVTLTPFQVTRPTNCAVYSTKHITTFFRDVSNPKFGEKGKATEIRLLFFSKLKRIKK